MALTRNGIADHIRNETGMSLKESFQATESLLEIIKTALESGDDVLLLRLGRQQKDVEAGAGLEFADASAHLRTVELGHHPVEHDEVGRVGL